MSKFKVGQQARVIDYPRGLDYYGWKHPKGYVGTVSEVVGEDSALEGFTSCSLDSSNMNGQVVSGMRPKPSNPCCLS